MGAERRKFHRVRLTAPMRFRKIGEPNAPWRDGTMLDLSEGGLRFESEQLIEPGMGLEFELRLPIRAEPLELAGQVIWCGRARAGVVTMAGVMFIGPTSTYQAVIHELVQFLLTPRKSSTHAG